MKLRNKKTGEIATKIDVSQDNESFWVLGNKPCMYKSLAELNEEWEDYKPAEPAKPLIKDEKVRKALRAWAEALEIECCMYDKGINAFAVGTVMINFPGKLRPETLQNGEIYKITELCGEEEE